MSEWISTKDSLPPFYKWVETLWKILDPEHETYIRGWGRVDGFLTPKGWKTAKPSEIFFSEPKFWRPQQDVPDA